MPLLLGFNVHSTCRSELARERLETAEFIQDARVIVDDLRE